MPKTHLIPRTYWPGEMTLVRVVMLWRDRYYPAPVDIPMYDAVDVMETLLDAEIEGAQFYILDPIVAEKYAARAEATGELPTDAELREAERDIVDYVTKRIDVASN